MNDVTGSDISTRNNADTEVSLDQQKFQFEKYIRINENDIKRREINLKEMEFRRTKLWNPTSIAIVVATFGIFGSLFVALINGKNQKAIEEQKMQANLIVQAVSTGDPKEACSNLQSFLKLGLITDSYNTIAKCATSLDKIPVLPPSISYTPKPDKNSGLGFNESKMAVKRDEIGEIYNFTVNFTVPESADILVRTNNNIDTIKVYFYRRKKTEKISVSSNIRIINGEWSVGEQVEFSFSVNKIDVEDQSYNTEIKFCIGSEYMCIPSSNINL